MIGRRVAALAGSAVLLMLLAGCAAPASHPASGPHRSGLLHVVQLEPRSLGAPAADTARVRLQAVQRAPVGEDDWTVGAVDPASRTLTMRWVDGLGPECGEANRVQVWERSDAVVVGVSDTARDPSLNCVAAGQERRYVLRLERPLGGRALLEPVTAVNDGLPHFVSAAPVPGCSTSAVVLDTPFGMPDARTRMAPAGATSAVVCRTAWPHGAAHDTEARVSGAAVAELVRTLDGASAQTPGTVPAPRCDDRSPGAWYAVYFAGPGLQVEVFIDEIGCGTVSNGARRGSTTPAIHRELAALFAG